MRQKNFGSNAAGYLFPIITLLRSHSSHLQIQHLKVGAASVPTKQHNPEFFLARLYLVWYTYFKGIVYV